MTMWDFAAQNPNTFYFVCLIAFLAIMHIADALASAYKSSCKKGDDDSC